MKGIVSADADSITAIKDGVQSVSLDGLMYQTLVDFDRQNVSLKISIEVEVIK